MSESILLASRLLSACPLSALANFASLRDTVPVLNGLKNGSKDWYDRGLRRFLWLHVHWVQAPSLSVLFRFR